jgi:hypothetical protein
MVEFGAFRFDKLGRFAQLARRVSVFCGVYNHDATETQDLFLLQSAKTNSKGRVSSNIAFSIQI